MKVTSVNEQDKGALRVKHLLTALANCSPEARVVLAVHHGIPEVQVDGQTVHDLARAGITLKRSGVGTVITLTNAVMKEGGSIVAPDQPQLSSVDLPGNMSEKEKILAEIERQTSVPMRPADAA
jgi:hypothetical protein